jgi:hypothetical protein
MAEITPREKEIEELKAELKKYSSREEICDSREERIALLRVIAETKARLNLLEGQAAGGVTS